MSVRQWMLMRSAPEMETVAASASEMRRAP
jgi:hypothetical protein